MRRSIFVAIAVAGLWNVARAADPIVRIGTGSYTTQLSPGAREPQREMWRTDRERGPVPTNDWSSSLVWMRFSERQYPHPLAVRAVSSGLQVYYPGPSITANRAAIFGFMPAGVGRDLVLGDSAAGEFPDARLDGHSDWFVRARFAAGDKAMTVSYGHGSPYVYATYEGGAACITFPEKPRVWAGKQADPVLGVTIAGRHYGLFGPTGSTWSGLDGNVFTNRPKGKTYFSLAILPKATDKTLALFQRHAYAHVTDTRFTGHYDPETGTVETRFTLTTDPQEGDVRDTLFALYPHQWRHADCELLPYEYASVRGTMKLGRGTSFTVKIPFPGVLPVLPNVAEYDRAELDRLLEAESRRRESGTRDTYWEGKRLGKLVTLARIAEQNGNNDAAETFRREIQGRLENWLDAAGPDGRPKRAGLFYYDDRWGTLIGYPASFGSDVELNDHHFHYGYFLQAAAEVARHDRGWASQDRYGGMVRLLIRDVAAWQHDDPMFPYLRNFDPYAGHSWASGHARFGDGNNNESSSEAMNAWCGMILWGSGAGDRTVRDLGIVLYTTELAAIEEYWFDVHGTNHPPDYPASVVTMIWGGKGANGTWFSANPEAVHGINWLPIHGGSLYLGRFPDYVQKNYEALVAENNGTGWDQWADLIWMYRALSDPDDAPAQMTARPARFRPEEGNSLANATYWIHNLKLLGRVDREVTADYPLYAVFRKGNRRTYVVYNMQDRPRPVRFSDGTQIDAKPNGFTVQPASSHKPSP